jgi:hypothetical protein
MLTRFWLENPKERDYLGGVVDRSIVLKSVSNKCIVKMLCGLSCLNELKASFVDA